MSIKLLYCAALLLNAIRAQTTAEATVLLPSPISLSGIVTDINGNPLPNAWVNHTGLGSDGENEY